MLQYSDSVEVLSGLSDHGLSESQRLASTMGIEPTNYRCDTGRAMLAIHCWIRLALSFHVVFIDTILKRTRCRLSVSIPYGSPLAAPIGWAGRLRMRFNMAPIALASHGLSIGFTASYHDIDDD